MMMTSQRMSDADDAWSSRPWAMALFCALGALAFYYCVDAANDARGQHWSYFGASAVAVTTLSFALTVELRRWLWAVAFALAWGLVLGGVAWQASGYNHAGNMFEWPFLSGVFALLLAAPLFQTARDAGRWQLDPMLVCHHMWIDAVLGAASLAFVGIVFLLAHMIASLFALIGIDFVKELLIRGDVNWTLAGFAFGGALGILRERDALVATVLRLVVIILSALAPVLAAALVIFLLSLPLTGLAGLWDGWLSAAALTMMAGAGSWLLLNAALGLGDEEKPPHPVLYRSAQVLAAVVLPLAALAFAALTLRVQQYGWTPERMWGVLAAGVALAFGVAGWWALWRSRDGAFAQAIRTAETRLTLAVCGLALLLALPILDFGAISARDQLARLNSGRVSTAKFDWQAMAFDFGPEGREALQSLVRRGTAQQRAMARQALAAENRYAGVNLVADTVPLTGRIASVPAGQAVPPDLLKMIDGNGLCRARACRVVWLTSTSVMVLGHRAEDQDFVVERWSRAKTGWQYGDGAGARAEDHRADLSQAAVEVRTVNRRQVFVDGKPVGEVFE